MNRKGLGRFAQKSFNAQLLFATCCSLLICCEYAAIRPCVNSLFLKTFSADIFPYTWLVAIPVNAFLVGVYNWTQRHSSIQRTFLFLVNMILLDHIFMGFFLESLPFLVFFYYLWKDSYILLLFQILWSLLHQTTTIQKSQYLYGIIFGFGGLGALLGSYYTATLVETIGSSTIFFYTIPFLLLLQPLFLLLLQHSTTPPPPPTKPPDGSFQGIQALCRSKSLQLICFICVSMQMSSTLLDFQFQQYLQKTFPVLDERSAILAKVMGTTHLITLFLQFLGAYALSQHVGVRNTHILIPCLLLCFPLGALTIPSLTLFATAMITIKTIDFSVFTVFKEMLYIPLTKEEKNQGKAIVDVFGHRAAKGIASLVILSLEYFTKNVYLWINISMLVLLCLWGLTVFQFFPDIQRQQDLKTK